MHKYIEHRAKAEALWRELWSIYFYQTDHDDDAVIDELCAALCPTAHHNQGTTPPASPTT